MVAGFDGGNTITSDAGALLLGDRPGDRAGPAVRRFFTATVADRVEQGLATLVGERVFALALAYEDLVDHATLRHDPVPAAVMGKLAARRPAAQLWPASRS